jgi:hypothetical protein
MTSKTIFDGTGEPLIRSSDPLTPFLTARKLKTSKLSRELRTARYFWQPFAFPKIDQLHYSTSYLQSISRAVRLDMLGCNLNCTFSLSSCSYTEQASSVACLRRQRSTRHLKMSCCSSFRFSTSTEIPSHLLKPTGTRSRLVSPKDQFRQHIDNQPHT